MDEKIERELEQLNNTVECNDSSNSLRHALRLTRFLFDSSKELHEKTGGVSPDPETIADQEVELLSE